MPDTRESIEGGGGLEASTWALDTPLEVPLHAEGLAPNEPGDPPTARAAEEAKPFTGLTPLPPCSL
jgi:hypothetical protein